MSYRLKPGRSISNEVKRLVDKQLALAVDELRAIGDRRSDDAIHEARRHVKTMRAVLRLVQPVLRGEFVRRIKRPWRPAGIAGGTAAKRVPWTRAA